MELIEHGGFGAAQSVTGDVTSKVVTIECQDPSLMFLGVFQTRALQDKSKPDSAPTVRTFEINVDGEHMYNIAITGVQKAGEVGAKYPTLLVTEKASGDKVLIAKTEIQAGNSTKPTSIFTYSSRGGAVAAGTDDDGAQIFAFGEAIKHGGDASGPMKKNKYPRTEYKVGGKTVMRGTTTFVKDYYFHGTFCPPEDGAGALAEFTYLQRNLKDENDEWMATVWRSMRCSAGVDALGRFVAGLALEQQWYWGFAMDED